VGSVSRSHSWRRRRSAMSPLILWNCRAKRLMCNIIVKFLMCHHLNHALNVGSKATKIVEGLWQCSISRPRCSQTNQTAHAL
jgi:hypothetical protein